MKPINRSAATGISFYRSKEEMKVKRLCRLYGKNVPQKELQGNWEEIEKRKKMRIEEMWNKIQQRKEERK